MMATLFALIVWALLATLISLLALGWAQILDVDRSRFAAELVELERENAALRRESLYWQRMALGIEPAPRWDPTLPTRLPKENTR